MYLYTKEIPFNFGLTKNIPLDRRFLFPSLADAISQTPKHTRYPGLMFFIMDDGDDHQNNTGYLYMWDNDTDTPVKVFDFLMRYCKFGLRLESPADYAGDVLREHLRKETYPKLGTMIYLDPIGITLIYTNNNTANDFMATNPAYYRYCFGDYHFATQAEYDNFPLEYKEVGAVVYIGNTKYIIENDINRSLSSPLLVYNPPTKIEDFQPGGSLQTKLQHDRYYLINGILCYCFEGVLYQIGEKIYRRRGLTLTRNHRVIHNLNTNFLDAKFVIRDLGTMNLNPTLVNTCHSLELQPVDLQTVIVLNEQQVTGDLIITALD